MKNSSRNDGIIRRIFRASGCFYAVAAVFFMVAVSDAAPRFALILSGGGARGLSQIGVLKALETENLRPDYIVATSMGAIIGSLYAAGYCADTIAAMARRVDWDAVFSNTAVRRSRFVSQKNEFSSALFELRFDYDLKPLLPTSISHGQAFYDLLAPLLTIPQAAAGSNFDSLPVPLRIIATDLLTGQRIIFSKGNLCNAIRASCAVPLAFSPVETDSFLLVDGGVSSNIPIETARQAGAAVVVAVDATSPLSAREELSNPVKIVDQLMAIGITRIKSEERTRADVVVAPHLDEFKNTDFRNIDLLISRGFAETRRQLPRIRQLLTPDTAVAAPSDTGPNAPAIDSSTRSPAAPNCKTQTPRQPVLSALSTSGNRRTSGKLLVRATGLAVGDTISRSTIRKTITSLYATDLFENVNLDIDSAGRGTVLVEEKKYWRSRFGLRFDEFHLGEGYIEPAYENCFGAGIATIVHLQYGLRRERYSVQVSGNQLLSRNFASNLQFQIYSSKERISEIDTMITDSVLMMSITTMHEHSLRKNGINLAVGMQLGRFSMLSAGVRLEKFKVQQAETDMLGDILGTSFKKSLPYFSLKLTMDSMDKYPFPTSGTKQFISIGAATEAIGGRYTFLKCTGNISRYFTINRIHTFCPRFSFAWASDILPEVERGYIGGAIGEERYPESSVYNYVPFSGLPPRGLIGDRFGILRLEYRCEIKHNLYTDLHFDWGTAWEAKNYDFKGLIEDAPLGIGLGLAYQTIFGPVRMSYGQLLKNSKNYLRDQSEFFYFSAGYDF